MSAPLSNLPPRLQGGSMLCSHFPMSVLHRKVLSIVVIFHMKIAECMCRNDSCSSHKMVLQCYIQHMILKSLRFMSMHTTRITNYIVENSYLLLLFEYMLPQTWWSKQKYRHFGWRQISTVASIYIQRSSIHRYGMCLMTDFFDHNILPFCLSLHTSMIWRFCEEPLLWIKDLVGYKLEWIYGLLGVLQYSHPEQMKEQ